MLKFDDGVKQTNLRKDEILACPIRIPPLSEQQKIANILTTVDDHISETEALIEKTKVLKQGLMQQLLTKGIGHTEFKDTEISRIPVEWEVVPFSFHAQICYGKNQKEVESDHGRNPILGTGGEIGRTDSFLYDQPSVLIGRKGTINKPMYIERPFWTVDTLFYTKVLGNTLPKWLFYFISSIDLTRYNEATGVPSLSATAISSIPVPNIPLPEQHQISAILTSVDDQIDTYQAKLVSLTRLKTGLMQQLLTGKIRVKV